jgi:NAD(P)-dependent dehydrogenase (short-subunit alcohol dehydrogenase family)
MSEQSTGRALQGKTAVVTGASSGIGMACAQVLADDGATVLIVGRNRDALASARASILGQAPDARVEAFAGDACNEEVVERALERAHGLSGRLDILVPAVGGPEYMPVLQLDAAGFRRQFELNCMSAFLMVRHGAPRMAQGGSIVCISTAAAGQTNMGLSAYGASKAALERFVRAAAFELGPVGIRINAVRPGATLSPEAIEARGLQRMATLFAAETPLGRIGEPLDIARAVRFLAGPEGAWITGETISADGGLQQGKAPDLGEVI